MAGILETFYILFKTDAGDAADEVKKLDRAADAVEGSLKKADGAARALGASFIDMARNFAAPLLSAVSLAGAIGLAFNRLGEIGDIADASDKMRSSAQDYDAFTRSVQAAGGSISATGADLASFSDKLSDAAARPDGPNAKNFAKWGILFKDAKGNAVGAVDGILALSKSLEGLDKAEAIGRLRRLGITDADTINVLLEGKAAIQERMEAERKAGVVSERQIEIEGEYASAVGQTNNLIASLGGNLVELLIPAITRGMEAFNKAFSWLLGHGKLVEGFFVGVGVAITAYYLPAMARAAAATIAATWPFLAIGAAVAAVAVAFALAYEDVRAFLDGQPSLIGSLAERYEWFAEVVRGVGDVFTWLSSEWETFVGELVATWGQVQEVFNALVEILGRVASMWVDAFSPVAEAFANLFRTIGDIIARFTDFGSAGAGAAREVTTAMDLIRGAVEAVGPAVRVVADIFTTVLGGAVSAVAALVNGIASAVQAVSNAISGIQAPELSPAVRERRQKGNQLLDPNTGKPMGDLFREEGGISPTSLGAGKAALGGASGAPQGLATPASYSNQSNVTVGSITVHTQATDAKGVAAAVRGELKSQLRTASAQFDDGVRA